MTDEELEKLRFPIGKFIKPNKISSILIQDWTKTIENFPSVITKTTKDLDSKELNWKYRPEGWNIKQIIHHCSDSHMNSLIRFKLALTEDKPIIKPYLEDKWAALVDGNSEDIQSALDLITGLHKKWVLLLKSLTPEQLERTFIHPEHGQEFSLAENIGIYAWHCRHHCAHIELALRAKGKYNT